MLRILPSLSILVAVVLAFAPTATAQTNGCEETDPCILILDVSAEGFENTPSVTIFTQGDWWELDVFNLDSVEHTISIEGYDVSFVIPPGENATSGGFPFDVAGEFEITDSPSGDSVTIQVIEGDSVDAEGEETDPGRETGDDDAGADDNGSPGLGLVALGMALLGAALFVSRRAK